MTCSKIGYPSRKAANRALAFLRSDTGGFNGASVYRCEKCGKWHIGNNSARSEAWHKIREQKKAARDAEKVKSS